MRSSIILSIVSFVHLFLAVYGSQTQPPTVKDVLWTCPKNWTLIYKANSSVCIMISRSSRSYRDAESFCEEMGGQLINAGANTSDLERLTWVTEHILAGYNDYWIGLSKQDDGRGYYTWSNQIRATRAQLRGLYPSNNNGLYCVYIEGPRGKLVRGDCRYSSKPFVCERALGCPAGRSGTKCERECHCMENACESIEGKITCVGGCVRGWLGRACDTPRVKPEVRYYCVNSGTHGMYVKLWIKTNKIEHVKLQAMNKNGELFPCNPTSLEQFTNPFGLIIVKMTSEGIGWSPGDVTCPELTDSDVKKWLVTVRENEAVFLENDAVTVISCDFKKGDTLIMSEKSAVSSELMKAASEPQSDAGDFSLALVDATTGENITQATLGQAVKLRAYFNQRNDSILTGVLPYNCEVTSQEKEQALSLLDQSGCPGPESPISSFQTKGKNYIETKWFLFFTLRHVPNGDLKFKCSYTLCFQGQLCEATCDATRRKRDATARDSTLDNTVATRTIRVLPSIKAQQVANPKPESTGKEHYVRHNRNGNNQNFETGKQSSSSPGVIPQFSPLMYLNPITCSLFLFLLTIFLVLFVIFLRSLRKSVDNMRKELEGAKSRDKFLQCGCLQQKEKEYVSCP